MVVCGKCGAENVPESKSCKSCGATLTPISSGPAATPSPPPGGVAKEMSDIGQRIGQDVGRAGEKFGKEMERRGSEFGMWWEKSLGNFSPLIIGLFGIIGFLVVILVVGAIAEVSDRPAFWNDLLDFLETYWWLFFLLSFYGAFQGYLLRKYRPVFMWINPVIAGLGFVVWFWILAQILHFAANDRGHTNLGDLGEFIEDMYIVIFVLVVIGGFLFAFFRSVSPSNWDKKRA
jgi:hypothetical protein